jgi:RNA polymerase sigma factor (sigma-70 family)
MARVTQVADNPPDDVRRVAGLVPVPDPPAAPGGAAALELEELAARAIGGDRGARSTVVSASLPLLRRLARRYAGGAVDLADLEQDAVVGLLRALERFDPARGTPFWAYARWWVRQALQQAVGESSRAARIPRHVLWDMHELKEARERLTRERRREPRAVELADALGWSVGRVDETLRAEYPASSLDEAFPCQAAAPADLLEDPLAADAYERVLIDLTAEQLRPALLQLSKREREILARRGSGESLRVIGRQLGVSAQRVQAIEGRALAKVRTAAGVGVDAQPKLITSSIAGAVPAPTIDSR